LAAHLSKSVKIVLSPDGMIDILRSRLPAHRGIGDGATTPFSVQTRRSEMINGFSLHETTTALAA
jgi:hypothetical protein